MSCDLVAFANPGIRGLSPYQAGKPIEELQRELGLAHVVKLASNENPLGPSPAVKVACERALADIARYPDSNGFGLKAALAAKLNVEPAQLTLGNGSNDLLDLIARVFLGPGSSAIYSEYGFVVYPIATQACGARAIVTPAHEWGHDLDAMAAAITPDTRLIFIANPNNPTGTALSRQQVSAFLERVPPEVVVVLDEAYTEYVESTTFPDGVALLAQYPNLVVTRTFSKAYGLAGLRVGYAVSGRAIADLLNRVRAPFNVNSLALAAAEAALRDADYLARARRLNSEGMRQLEAACGRLDLPYIPSFGNFLTVEVGDGALDIYQQLLREGVIVRPLTPYRMPRHLRVSIGLADENDFFVEALTRVLGRG